MPKLALRSVVLLALLAGALGFAAPAALAVDTPFSVRYAQTLRGSINAVGNQLLTCPAAAANCTNARDRVGTTTTLNNNYNMGYVDVDGDAATVNSSTSTLSLPAGATVVWAGLYWGADTSQGTGGSAAPDAANLGNVRFKVDSGGYQTVTAAPADVLTSTGRATRYRAFANVTALLPASGNATYTVADVQTGRGDDRFAGWSLVVAYQDSTQAVHRVSVYDGLGTVDATRTFSTDITPFFTPASGTVATKTGLLAFEGDAGIVGETASFNGTPLTDAINGPGNLMNSTMAVDGTLFTDKNPNYGNLMGTDIDVWNSMGLLGNHQSTATLAFTSNQDLFVPSALWLVSDEGPAANATGPTVGGLARDGSTLTADPGTWNGTPTITYDHQWQRCDAAGGNCVDIPGATGSTHTLTAADVGSTVRVLVTAVNDAGSSTPAPSPPTTTITQLPPSNVTLPALSGTQQDGQTLTADPGAWTGTGPIDFTYQWQRCDAAGANCVDIAGATDETYALGTDDLGSTVRVVVTGDNGEQHTANSPAVGPVAPLAPTSTSVPTVSGTVGLGDTLTAGDGTWDGSEPLTFAYQWQRCDEDGTNCADIPGATDPTYTLVEDDQGHSIVVVVTATNVVDSDTSASDPILVPAPPVNTVAPSISGDEEVGETLTAAPGTWSGTGPIDYTYQWERCDFFGLNCVDIAGATDPTYTLTGNDLGHTIQVEVGAGNAAGSAEADAPTTPAVDNPTLTPTATPTPTPKRPVSSSPGVTSGPLASDSAFAAGGLGGDDLGSVPGSLVGDASCQQLAGNSKYSRVKAKGIGTVRVRAYSTGPATKVSPVLVTTQISGGKAKQVTYKLDGRRLKAKRGRSWKSAITPAKLQKIGIHTLKATVKGRKKGAKTKVVKLKLKTVPCRTLFTAQRWRTTAGAGLRLRIDARTAMQRVSFTVAAPLLPRRMKTARTIGFMRVFVAGERGRRRYSLKLARKGGKQPLVAGVGKPTVKLRKGKIDVIGLPARAAVAELTLYRVKKLDGNTKRRVYKLRARVAPTGGTLSVRPKAPR